MPSSDKFAKIITLHGGEENMNLKDKLQRRTFLRRQIAVRNVLWLMAVTFVVAGLFVGYERVPLPYVGVLFAFCAFVYGRKFANKEHRDELAKLSNEPDLVDHDLGRHGELSPRRPRRAQPPRPD